MKLIRNIDIIESTNVFSVQFVWEHCYVYNITHFYLDLKCEKFILN